MSRRKKKHTFAEKVAAVTGRLLAEGRYGSYSEAEKHARAIVGVSKARKRERLAAARRASKVHREAFHRR